MLDGDRILYVDDLEITLQTTADELQAALRGPVGQEVSLKVGRLPDYSPHTFNIIRQEIALPSVTWRLAPDEPRLGVLKVNVVAASTTDEIRTRRGRPSAARRNRLCPRPA